MHVYLLVSVTIQGRPTEKAKGQKFAVLSLTDAMKHFNVSTRPKFLKSMRGKLLKE
jgi:hypothetical protein